MKEPYSGILGAFTAWEELIRSNLSPKAHPSDSFILKHIKEIPISTYEFWQSKKFAVVQKEKKAINEVIKRHQIKLNKILTQHTCLQSQKFIPSDRKKEISKEINERLEKIKNVIAALKQQIMELDRRYVG